MVRPSCEMACVGSAVDCATARPIALMLTAAAMTTASAILMANCVMLLGLIASNHNAARRVAADVLVAHGMNPYL